MSRIILYFSDSQFFLGRFLGGEGVLAIADSSYLKLDDLLVLQVPLSLEKVPGEMLFPLTLHKFFFKTLQIGSGRDVWTISRAKVYWTTSEVLKLTKRAWMA